jgi:hypothetical protein
MSESDNSSSLLNLLERIAEAIREELGEEIDAYPGCRSPEGADPLNRAFRAVVRSLLASAMTATVDRNSLVSQALRQLAERRLAAEGWEDRQIKFLSEDEPGGPDDWLAFLILSSRQQIEPLLDPDH